MKPTVPVVVFNPRDYGLEVKSSFYLIYLTDEILILGTKTQE